MLLGTVLQVDRRIQGQRAGSGQMDQGPFLTGCVYKRQPGIAQLQYEGTEGEAGGAGLQAGLASSACSPAAQKQ